MAGRSVASGFAGSTRSCCRQPALLWALRCSQEAVEASPSLRVVSDPVELPGRLPSIGCPAAPGPTVAGLGREYLTGLVKLDKQLLILLDIDKILTSQEEIVLKQIKK